jgi:NAD(P)-dependent dehydrogenase (short-subunit alcohol dehydrogenase family)
MNLPYTPDFHGKVAVVTGGAGVLCAMFAKALAACGAAVAVLDLAEEKAQEVAAEIKAAGGVT